MTQTQSTTNKLTLINKARSVLRGQKLSSSELKTLYRDLEKMDQFAYATEVLLTKMKQDEEAGTEISLKEYQTLAKYIYKDHSLPSGFKFDKALQELKVHDNLACTSRCETLGLAGAIYKRRWQFDHQFKNLTLSHFYYKKGFDSWKGYLGCATDAAKDPDKNDDGYTAINYAFINDLMAVDKLEEHGRITGVSENIAEQFQEAKNTREFILEQFIQDPNASDPELKQSNYASWVLATVAEAYFGLGRYECSLKFITLYLDKEQLHPWEIRTFHQQLFSIAYLQTFQRGFSQEPGSANTQNLLTSLMPRVDSEKINICLSAFNRSAKKEEENNHSTIVKKDGKFGLALSGGGFRASLFHIGVLAALAEKDELKNVEVLSCVSGGSIIGAYYYLKLKVLLETKNDDEITQEDYIKIIQDIEIDFLKGIQENLRVRLFANLSSNFKMLFSRHYSRTHRLGELYDQYLYSPLIKKAKKQNPGYKLIPDDNKGAIYMHDLFINPKDVPENFSPATDNWQRKNKIPQLILNATSVNTGHNWQFTASWMGEPPGNIQTDVDVKPRLRRMYYSEAPDIYQKFRLGNAVGASSCVPVIFYPMPMSDLYPDIDLQLIDGGLHDNQGIAALIEQECKNMFISDASGQLPTNNVSVANEVSLFFRADNILQERLRELQFLDITERTYTTQINKLYTVQLKNDLKKGPVNWKYCTDPPRSLLYADVNDNDLTKYGVLRSVQLSLSEIRTDLDSFHDVEAWGLMYSGYAQTMYEYDGCSNSDTSKESLWQFFRIHGHVTIPAKADEINDLLIASKKVPGKLLEINKLLRFIVYGILVILGIGVIWWGARNWDKTFSYELTVKSIFFLVIILALTLFVKPLAMVINYKGTIRKYIALLLVAIFGFVFSNIYVGLFNGIYIKSGRLKNDSIPKSGKPRNGK